MFYTLNETKKTLFDAICNILNLPSTTEKVRFAYSDNSSSFFLRGEDITYIDLNLIDDAVTKYTQQMLNYNGNAQKIIDDKNLIINRFTCLLTSYGDNSYYNIIKLRDGFLRYNIKLILKQSGLKPIPHFISPVRISEEFQGKWINRWNFKIDFYQENTIEKTIPSILELGDLNIIPNK